VEGLHSGDQPRESIKFYVCCQGVLYWMYTARRTSSSVEALHQWRAQLLCSTASGYAHLELREELVNAVEVRGNALSMVLGELFTCFIDLDE
jgi:hypothetical protein